jgi:cytochrome c1
VVGANGRVGPSLAGIGERSVIAGMLPNTVDNLVFWIQHPQQVLPGNDMPELSVSDPAARDIAAYLYTLR